MKYISTATIAEVIILAREGVNGDLEFDALIRGLDDDAKAELTALMWIGRGSFDADELDEAIRTVREEASTPTEDYLRGTPHLADHLEAALDVMGIDVRGEEDAL